MRSGRCAGLSRLTNPQTCSDQSASKRRHALLRQATIAPVAGETNTSVPWPSSSRTRHTGMSRSRLLRRARSASAADATAGRARARHRDRARRRRIERRRRAVPSTASTRLPSTIQVGRPPTARSSTARAVPPARATASASGTRTSATASGAASTRSPAPRTAAKSNHVKAKPVTVHTTSGTPTTSVAMRCNRRISGSSSGPRGIVTLHG